MHNLYHLVINFLIAIILFFLFPNMFPVTAFIIITIMGSLVDIDHIFYYAIKGGNQKKDFKESNPHFYIFHTIESLILFAVLSFFLPIFLFIFLGSLIHNLFDILTYIYIGRYDFLKYSSIIYFLLE